MESMWKEYDVGNGLMLYCSSRQLYISTHTGGADVSLHASLGIYTRDAALRLASVLAEAAMLLPETPAPVIVAPTTSYTEVYAGEVGHE